MKNSNYISCSVKPKHIILKTKLKAHINFSLEVQKLIEELAIKYNVK